MAILQFLILLLFIMAFASIGAVVFIRLLAHTVGELSRSRMKN
jgi:hypothetical protein